MERDDWLVISTFPLITVRRLNGPLSPSLMASHNFRPQGSKTPGSLAAPVARPAASVWTTYSTLRRIKVQHRHRQTSTGEQSADIDHAKH